MQLINSNVFEEKTQKRTEAIEATRKQHLASQNAREASPLTSHLHQRQGPRVAAGFARANPQPNLTNAGQDHVIDIQGISFRVICNGSKLVKVAGTSSRTSPPHLGPTCSHLPGDLHSASATPKVAVVGGVQFRRSKNGNLYRQGVIKLHPYVCPPRTAYMLTHDRHAGVKKVNVPCRMFSSTGIFRLLLGAARHQARARAQPLSRWSASAWRRERY